MICVFLGHTRGTIHLVGGTVLLRCLPLLDQEEPQCEDEGAEERDDTNCDAGYRTRGKA
jgi:hypothetical protein